MWKTFIAGFDFRFVRNFEEAFYAFAGVNANVPMLAVMMCTCKGFATTYAGYGPITNVLTQTLYVIAMSTGKLANIADRTANLAFHPLQKTQIFIQLVETYVEFVLNPK